MAERYKILVIAGEVSGDRIAADALRKTLLRGHEKGLDVELYGIAGDECRAIGMHCHYTTEQMQVVGFLEVAKKYRFFKSVFTHMKWLLDDPQTQPDVVILVDYPGFNIRFAREAKARGIRVVYYVSPQVWAWKPGRIRQLVETVDTMLVVFPFEVELYKNAGMEDVRFVGHPLVELLLEEEKTFSTRAVFADRMLLPSDKPWLLVFPGSRTEEVERHLQVMIEAAKRFARREYHIIIVKSPSLSDELYNSSSPEPIFIRASSRDIHELMYHSILGILKSGTTTLEAGLLQLPGVICYKTSMFTYELARRMMKLNMIGLVNIVLGKKLYPELIQKNMSVANISGALTDVSCRIDVFSKELSVLRSALHVAGELPSEQVASVLLQ